MPPLREMREETPLLANHFLKEYCRETARMAMEFSHPVMRKLTSAAWPGNIRQLRNEVMRLAACSPRDLITEEEMWMGLPAPMVAEPPASSRPLQPQSLKKAIAELERRMIREALETTKNNQQQAARALGLSRQGLINKMKRYAIAG